MTNTLKAHTGAHLIREYDPESEQWFYTNRVERVGSAIVISHDDLVGGVTVSREAWEEIKAKGDALFADMRR